MTSGSDHYMINVAHSLRSFCVNVKVGLLAAMSKYAFVTARKKADQCSANVNLSFHRTSQMMLVMISRRRGCSI